MNDDDIRKMIYLLESQSPWLPDADVTLDGTVMTGLIDRSAIMANDAITKMMES